MPSSQGAMTSRQRLHVTPHPPNTTTMANQSPMRIRLSPERRASLLRAIKEHFSAEHVLGSARR